ncbi:MAG TPA: hypothetical protein VHT97_08880 [Acidimicrobiales bacterium]|jgi:PhnB protein|nr:hypothetical protein [Acidimicrobiales bacterium]
MADVNPIPEGYPQVIPYLCIDGAAAAIEFYGSVFGATERMRMPGPGDTIGHAELQFGDAVVMLSDEFPGMNVRSPTSVGGTPASSAGASVAPWRSPRSTARRVQSVTATWSASPGR